MKPIRRRPHDAQHESARWLRLGVMVAVGVLLVAAIAMRERVTPSTGDVRATRSESSTATGTNTTEAPSTSDNTDTPPPTSPPETSPSDASPPDNETPPTTDTPATLPPVSDNPEAALADPNFFVTFLPQLRSMPAPSWVAQGTRMSYYASAASVPMSYHRYVEDEDGAWVDPTTGERYRQEDIQSAAGHGYNQVSVTELNDAVAVLSVRAYGLTDLGLDSPVTTLTWGGVVGIPGAGSDYWLHPDVLAEIDEVVSSDLKIVRMPYVIDDSEFSTIWIQSLGDNGNYTWVYDLDTGVLLHTASSTAGPPITGPVAAGEGREGSTFLTQSTLVAVRDTYLPWVTSAAPSWIGSVGHLDYTGTIWVGAGGGSPILLDASLAVDRVSSGANWVRYVFARTIYSDVAPSVTEYMERIDGIGQIGGVWLPPDGLAELSEGQELDRDPVTQTLVTVAAVEQTESGWLVTISETGPGEESELVYEVESGLLVSSSTMDLHLGSRIDYQFSSWS
jgi:hypothetical protein